VQGDVGAAAGLLQGLDGVAALPGRLPADPVLGPQAGSAGYHGDLVRDDESGVEADTELADELAVLGLVAAQVLQEFAGAGAGDGTDQLGDLLAVHADAVVGDGDRAGLLVHLHLNPQIGILLQQRVIGQGLEAQLLRRIRGVGDQLAHKDLFVRIE